MSKEEKYPQFYVTCLINGKETVFRMRPKKAHYSWSSMAEDKLERLHPQNKEARRLQDSKTRFWVHQEAMYSDELMDFIYQPRLGRAFYKEFSRIVRSWGREQKLDTELEKELANIETDHQHWLSPEMTQLAHRVYGSRSSYENTCNVTLLRQKEATVQYIKSQLLEDLDKQDQQLVMASLDVYQRTPLTSGPVWITDEVQEKLVSVDAIKAVFTTREFLHTFAPAEFKLLQEPIFLRDYYRDVFRSACLDSTHMFGDRKIIPLDILDLAKLSQSRRRRQRRAKLVSRKQ